MAYNGDVSLSCVKLFSLFKLIVLVHCFATIKLIFCHFLQQHRYGKVLTNPLFTTVPDIYQTTNRVTIRLTSL